MLIPAFAVLGQFTRPESLLTPNYEKAHLAHARLCILVAIAIAVTIAALRMVAWPIALATVLCAIGVATLFGRPIHSKWISLFALAWPMQFLLMQPAARLWLRDFLRGDHGHLVALLLGASGVALLLRWARDATNFQRQLAEKGVYHPVFAMQDLGRAQQAALANKNQTGWAIKAFMDPVASEVAQSIQDFNRSNPVSRRRLLAAPSNVPTTWIIPLFAVANLVILGLRYYNTGTTTIDSGVSAITTFVASHAIVGCIATVKRQWFSRRPLFANELCRPNSRREFIDDIFLISRSNLARPVLAVCTIQAALAFVSYNSWLQAASAGIGLAVLLIGFATISYAVGMWAITLEKDWMLTLVFGGVVCGALGVFAAVTGLSGFLGSKLFVAHPMALATVGFAMFLIGLAVLLSLIHI